MNQKFTYLIYSFWGKHPNFYAWATWLTFLGKEKVFRARAVEKINLKKGDTVLDLACGTGRNFRELIKAVGPEGQVIGFDFSASMLEGARRLVDMNGWQNVKLVQGDATELVLPEKIDGAISTLGMSAITESGKAIQRVYNQLKAGTALVVCDAKLFEGIFRIFNPLIEVVYKFSAAWDWAEDIPGKMEDIFENVEVERYCGEAFYVAIAKRK